MLRTSRGNVATPSDWLTGKCDTEEQQEPGHGKDVNSGDEGDSNKSSDSSFQPDCDEASGSTDDNEDEETDEGSEAVSTRTRSMKARRALWPRDDSQEDAKRQKKR